MPAAPAQADTPPNLPPRETLPAKLWRYAFVSVSRVGEKLGVDWLTYNWGVTRSFHQGALENAPRVVQAITETFPAVRSVADVGCGTGVYTRRFIDKGLAAVACEYSPRGRRKAQQQGVTCHPFDVSKDDSGMPGKPYDLAMSLEVAEHVPEFLADAFVAYMCNTSDLIVFTAAYPGQGGIGHINEQPRSYWIAKYNARGFTLDEPATQNMARRLTQLGAPPYLPTNMMVFRRTGHAA
ncbi:MAG: class I SAM-dependent methyltransferase [Planctomycetota bacterium]|nr:class I SAM-dependent methyltransferase [Planctomycetota bacterium]